MSLRTLHSDVSAPEQVLAAYACPECGSERRLPMSTTERGERETA
jgi:RNase P subunit RPR2